MPSAASGKWSGIAGVHKLLGIKALKRLEKEESLRVIECAKKFLAPNGIAVTFQKNAWNALRSNANLKYKIDRAKKGQLKDQMKGLPDIPLLGVPPTRLSGPCSKILRRLLEEQRHTLPKNTM